MFSGLTWFGLPLTVFLRLSEGMIIIGIILAVIIYVGYCRDKKEKKNNVSDFIKHKRDER